VLRWFPTDPAANQPSSSDTTFTAATEPDAQLVPGQAELVSVKLTFLIFGGFGS
jgi:hypothetical protein